MQQDPNSNNEEATHKIIEELQGRKRAKREEGNSQAQQLDYRNIIFEKFDSNQIKRLVHHLKTLENYYKFMSLEIQHQEKSITYLPEEIVNSCPEIKNRVSMMISRAKANVEFLDLMLLPYKSLVLQALLAEKRSMTEDQVAHDHSCSSHSTIANLFYHMVRQWGETPEITYVTLITQYLSKHWQRSSEENQKAKILVVGSGMGRLVHNLKSSYPSAQVQGHQTDTQLYLCGEYFLNRCRRSHEVYPYLHNFCNFLNNDDPYRCIKIPAVLDDHSYYYPLTLGNFPSLYKTHDGCWDVIVTTFNNYHIENILSNLRLLYKMLKPGGIWVDVSTSNFNRNLIPFSYRQYENILDHSQFKLLDKGREEGFWFGDSKCLMNEMRVNYYRVMQK